MSNLSVKSGPGGQRVVTSETIAENAVVLQFFGRLSNVATRYSIQVGLERHLEPGESGNDVGQFIWRFINHSCEPNGVIDYQSMTLLALKDINDGDQITVNYNSSEGELVEPFDCQCGSEKCLGRVTGYFGLNDQQKEQIKTLAAPYFIGEMAVEE